METPSCPGCLQRDTRIAELERRVAELEARLGSNATNSSIPPSANPPGAPKPVTKKPSGRKPGGQPGHPAHLRRRLPPPRLTRTIPFVPSHGDRCHEPLPPNAGPEDPEPTWHQVAELPTLAAQVTEYQGHFRTGPGCGTRNHAPIPADRKAHSIGPRLAALLAYLAGRHHLSKRGLEEITEAAFAVPLALGTVSRLEQQMSQALAPAHAEALEAVREAPVKQVDETGWKQAGQKRWLWLAATATVAVFLIHARRNWTALKALLGEKIKGFVTSDRWSVYNRLSVWRRQVCWAHLKRDFQKGVDRGGPGSRIGEVGLDIVRRVFHEWHLFRGGSIDRPTLQAHLDPVGEQLERLLRRGRRCADSQVAVFCENLLVLVPALWRFVVTEGIDPTNNHAERLLRRGVLWRKQAFGCQSADGCRFVERLLTVVQTCRLLDRPVLRYLQDALVAHRQGLPAPSLLSVG